MGFRRPRILICVPAGATPVERRAVYETAYSAGARKVYMVEEPVAAALGSDLPVDEPTVRWSSILVAAQRISQFCRSAA